MTGQKTIFFFGRIGTSVSSLATRFTADAGKRLRIRCLCYYHLASRNQPTGIAVDGHC